MADEFTDQAIAEERREINRKAERKRKHLAIRDTISRDYTIALGPGRSTIDWGQYTPREIRAHGARTPEEALPVTSVLMRDLQWNPVWIRRENVERCLKKGFVVERDELCYWLAPGDD